MSIRTIVPVNRRVLLAGGGAGLLLTACSDLIGPQPEPQIYVLRPTLPDLRQGPSVKWALAVDLPEATDNLASERIAISRTATTMDIYDAQWPDRLPVLIQKALVEAFETSGRVGQVARDNDNVRADCLLQTDIRDFEARYDAPDGAPVAVVRISAKLVTEGKRMIVGHTIVSQEAPASQNSIDAAVQAFDKAAGAAIGQIVNWALAAPVPARG